MHQSIADANDCAGKDAMKSIGGGIPEGYSVFSVHDLSVPSLAQAHAIGVANDLVHPRDTSLTAIRNSDRHGAII